MALAQAITGKRAGREGFQQGGYGFTHDQAWSCVVALSWSKRLGISVPDG